MVRDTGIQIEVAAAAAAGQTLVEGTLSPENNAPDIVQVLGVDANAAINSAEAQDNKADIEGVLAIRVLYLCREGMPHGFEATSVFKHTLDMPGAKAGMRCQCFVALSRVDYSLTDARNVSVNAVLDVEGKTFENVDTNIAGDVEGVELLKKQVKTSKCIAKAGSGFMIREDIRLDNVADPPAEILSSNAYARVRQITADGANAAVEGDIRLNTVYRDENDNVSQHTQSIPFGQIVPMGTLLENAELSAEANVREAGVNIAGENILNAEFMMHVNVNANKEQSADIIEDAYSTNQAVQPNIRKVNISGPTVSGTGKAPIRQQTPIPSGMPIAEKVLCVLVNPVVMGKAAQDNKVNVEGVLQTQVIYSAEEEGVKSFSADVPFKAAADINGIKENMKLDIDAKAEQAAASANADSIDLRVTLDIAASGSEKSNVNMVESISALDQPLKQQSGIIIYFPGRGETLWGIAKRFGTTVKSIEERNNIDNAQDIEGQKIILFCPPKTAQ
ncbi:MAG: DUF3794 and LysM peptidoglycan-binding domain-containing protein [Christensenellales bacterium]|jgi:LysM repeat protein